MEIKEFIDKFKESCDIDDGIIITDTTTFRDLDDWNSLNYLSLISLFKEEFNKNISRSEIKDCDTIKDLYELI